MEAGYIYVHNNIFPTLLAISEDEQATGLMGELWPPPIMSFIYAHPQINRFWMKNTPSPLDIVFCRNGKIAEICKGEPHSTAMVGNIFSDLVVEFPYGTVATSGIELGHEIGLVKPTPAELKVILAKKYHGIVKI
jgi:uncharacterized membrane protein (UPF0127 family)